MEELLKKLGYSDEQIQAILKGMTEAKIYTTKEEKIEERYTKLKEQKEDLEGQLKTANTTIGELKKNNADNEELQTKVKEYETTIETLTKDSEAKIRNLTLDTAISNWLAANKAKHSDLLTTKFDRKKLVVNEDGTVTGIDEQGKTFKESYKDLFEQTLGGISPDNNGSATDGEVTDMRSALAQRYEKK